MRGIDKLRKGASEAFFCRVGSLLDRAYGDIFGLWAYGDRF
jgi:hypothetical protein